MLFPRALLILTTGVLPALGATFGTVVTLAQPVADLVLDEARQRIYVVNTDANDVEVYATNTNPPHLTTHHPHGSHSPGRGSLAFRKLALCGVLRRFGHHHRQSHVGVVLDHLGGAFGQAPGHRGGIQRAGSDLDHRHRHGRGRAGHLRPHRLRQQRAGIHCDRPAGAHRSLASAALERYGAGRSQPPAGVLGWHHDRRGE